MEVFNPSGLSFYDDDDLDTQVLFSNVLLVEDEPAHAALIQRALSNVVGELSHVRTANEALRHLETSMVELIFCDLHLPDRSGLELIQTIRQVRPHLPIVVLTSSNNLEHAIKAMQIGAWDYMVKHFTESLEEQMKLVVSSSAARKLQLMREAQLRAERDAFWAAVHTAADGVSILGAQGAVVFSNQAFDDFAGTISTEILNTKPYNVVDLVALADFTVADSLRLEISGSEAESIWTSELLVPVCTSSGDRSTNENMAEDSVELRNFALTVSSVGLGDLEDIDLSHSSAPKMKRLVMWVRDITRQKEQEKFQRDLLSTTSHDLKGPLGAILTSAELLGDRGEGSQPDRSFDLVTRIASCARNSITIIDELLSARRIQDGVLVVRPQWFDVGEILEDMMLDYLPVAKSKSITFQSRPTKPGLKVFADRIGLQRVLGNLVSNAIKFTPKDGAVILSAEEGRGEVQISVSDSGSGIDPKTRRVLFERYARLEQHQQIEGTGLGLYVTKNIIDAHNGRIEVRSEIGVGSKFIVSFPNGVD